LIGAEFADLPANELADPERFENVETRIKRSIEVEVCVRADDLDGNWQDWLPELDESESSA
ncbi:MAG: hypothetical protein ACRDNP_13905, partial [Gaiellaceae bacterium]